MKKKSVFIIVLGIFYGISFMIHLQLSPGFKSFLIRSYSVNAIMSIIALLLLGFGMQQKKNNLANLYLATVAMKLIVYFLYFHPQFHAEGSITRKEFFMFFIPYALGLLAEIILLARRYR